MNVGHWEVEVRIIDGNTQKRLGRKRKRLGRRKRPAMNKENKSEKRHGDRNRK